MFHVKLKTKRFLPRILWDIFSFGFLVLIIPLIFWFETCIVIPAFYDDFTFWRIYHSTLAVFLLFQIVSNFIYVIIVDTSIQCVVLPSDLREDWRFCARCECIVPPRSYHCNICDTCILKRDHHCRFSACCIGHYNHRYFMMFLFYLTLGTVYATYFNLFFILNYINFNWSLLMKVMLPVAFLVFGLDTSTNHCYLIMFIIVVIGSLVGLLLLVYHASLIQHGVLTYEKNHKVKGYNEGWKKNCVLVFGVRWYLVWLAPFVASPLPTDGVSWEMQTEEHLKIF